MLKKLICTVLLLMPLSAFAHHGTAGQFDASRILTVSGVISDMAFVNPHAYVYVDVTDENGEVATWNCELRAASVMRRSGWTEEMFSNGTQVDIVGVAAHRDPLGCYVETISFNGGAPIERYAQIEENQLQPENTRPAVTAWGDPNIAGDWAATQRLVGAISGPNAMTMGPPMGMGGRGPAVEFTTAGAEALARLATDEADNVTGRLDCMPRDFFSDWVFDQPSNRIIQEENKIVLMYGFMDTVRTIHLDLDEHPDNIEPSWAGHSIGKWEDDVLVVDTIGFTEGSYRSNVHSTSYHTIERFSLTLEGDKLALVRDYEARDPKYWQEGAVITGQQTVYLADYPYQEYACDDRSVE